MRSIRFTYTLFEIVTLVIITVFFLSFLTLLQRTVERYYTEEQTGKVRQIDMLIEGTVTRSLSDFRELTMMRDRESGLKFLQEFSEVFIVTGDKRVGRMLRSKKGGFIFPGFDISRSALSRFLDKVTPDRIDISPMSRSMEGGELSLYIASREQGGWLVGRIDLVSLRNSIREIAHSTGTIIILATKDGYILSSTVEEAPFPILPDRTKGTVAYQEGEYAFSRAHSRFLDNEILILTPMTMISDLLWKMRIFALGSLVLMLAMIAVKILLQSRLIINPLGDFSAMISRWDIDSDVPEPPQPLVRYQETHDLFDTFKKKAVLINESVETIRKSRQALQTSERQMKAIVEGSPVPQFVISKDHLLIHWNRALEEYSGIRAEDVVGTNRQWQAFYDHERPCLADLLVDGAMDRVPQLYEGRYSPSRLIDNTIGATDFFPAMKGGKGAWLYFTAVPIREADGSVIGAVETLVDVTERKMAEEAFRLNAERLDTLLRINQMSDRPLNEIMEFAFDEAVKITRSEIGYLGLMNPDETLMEVQAWSRNVMEACLTDEKMIRFPVENAGLWAEAVRQRRPVVTNDYGAPDTLKKGCPEGHVPIRRHMSVPVMAGSRIVLLAGVGNKAAEYDEADVQQLRLLMEGLWRIVERKQAEDERKRLEDQLTQAQKIESVGRLAGGVAHDFNNMLTPIIGYTEMLLMDLTSEDPLHGVLSEILRAAERSRDLVRQLLAFARKQTLEMKPVDLNRVITGFENMLRRTLHENVTVKMNLSPSLGSILADVGQVEQVILNLAVNAQDAMPEGGKLFIETSFAMLDYAYASEHTEVRPGPYIVLEITDTGVGIDRDSRDKIFDPFFTTKGVGKGTGLGLATVYGIVKQHGGHISVYSEPGQGTTFRLYFPAHVDLEETPRTETGDRDVPLKGKEVILVVEDQDQVRALATSVLKRYGYRILEACDLKTARETAASYQGDIHLMITDVILPDGNGRELYESLAGLGKIKRVLYMSGYPSDVISHHGVLDTGVQFIQKPFTIKGLTMKVQEMLGA